MNIKKYRKHYLASLHGSIYDEKLDRTFPIVRGPQRYTSWDEQHPDQPAAAIDPSNVWVASDHHFDHANIMKYANRQFKSTDQMNQFMIDQHNAVVGTDDVVIMGGDVAFCATGKANTFLQQLNGYKILIIGNHDWERKTGKLKAYTVDEIHMSYFIDVGDVEVLISHVPFNSSLMMFNGNLMNLHGHIHDKLMPHERYVNMCVEHIDYQPQRLIDILGL